MPSTPASPIPAACGPWRAFLSWAPALAVLTAYAGLAAVDLRANRWDITAFIVAGDRFADRAQLDAPIAVLSQSPGYDGQFYYRLGLDPFTAEPTAHGITIDNPATRGARILYPLLAWVASWGRPPALPWAMLGFNLTGLFALAAIGVAIARRHAAPAWMGLLPSLYPGFIVTVIRDTTEVTAITLSAAAVAFALRNQAWRAAPFAAAAVFARETTLFALAGFGVAELARCLRARRASAALFAYASPALVFAAWQAAVLQHWHLTSFSGTSQNFGAPLAGIARFFALNLRLMWDAPETAPGWNVRKYWLLAAATYLVATALVAIVAVRVRISAGLCLSWAFYAALTLSLSTAIWVEPYDFLRACTDGFVFGALLVIVSGNRIAGAALVVLVIPAWLQSAQML